MLVLQPTTVTRTMIRSYVRGAVGVALLCGLLAGAAFMTMPPRARGATPDQSRSAKAPPLRDTRSAPASARFAELTDSLARDVDHLASIPSVLPTVGWVSSRFTLRRYHPVFHVTRPHEGIDIAAPMGAPVVAPAAGVVVTIAERAGYGLLLELDHGHGLVTRYGHLSRVRVRAGQAVTRGQLLANVGSSGLSTGPHLHYEIRVAGEVVDPLLFGP
jgi:murein DD-endopeptidase MepM/ murein hydrolase activator NlpD